MAWGNGGGVAVEGEPEAARLRFELMRLRGRLEVREAELHRLAAMADLHSKDAKLRDAPATGPEEEAQEGRQGHGGQGKDGAKSKEFSADETAPAPADEEIRALQGQVEKLQGQLRESEERARGLQKDLRAAREEVKELKAAAHTDSSDLEDEARELRREARAAAADNLQLRQRVEELAAERAKESAKLLKMDAKIMHAAAEAELTRMEREGGAHLWSTGALLLSSAAAAVATGLIVLWAKRSSSA